MKTLLMLLLLAQTDKGGKILELAWSADEVNGSPLLPTSTGKLTAYRVKATSK